MVFISLTLELCSFVLKHIPSSENRISHIMFYTVVNLKMLRLFEIRTILSRTHLSNNKMSPLFYDHVKQIGLGQFQTDQFRTIRSFLDQLDMNCSKAMCLLKPWYHESFGFRIESIQTLFKRLKTNISAKFFLLYVSKFKQKVILEGFAFCSLKVTETSATW